MVVLKSPFGSLQASGTIANLLTYRKANARHVAGVKTTPKQPRTEAQRATRLFMTWLSGQWTTFTDNDKATWLNFQETPLLSPYHAYLRYNLDRVKHLPGKQWWAIKYPIYPTIAYPAAKNTDPATLENTVLTGLSRSVDYRCTLPAINDNWMVMLFRQSAESSWPIYRNMVHAATVTVAGVQHWLIPNQEPGVQSYLSLLVSRTGKPRDHFSGPRSCTVLP